MRRVEPGIRVRPQQGGGGFKTGLRVKPGIRVGEDGGGGGLKFSICGSKNCFSFPALV